MSHDALLILLLAIDVFRAGFRVPPFPRVPQYFLFNALIITLYNYMRNETKFFVRLSTLKGFTDYCVVHVKS